MDERPAGETPEAAPVSSRQAELLIATFKLCRAIEQQNREILARLDAQQQPARKPMATAPVITKRKERRA